MAAHRYWALNTVVSNVNLGGVSGYVLAIAELAMRGAEGGANLCTGGAVWSTGGWLASAGLAFDGDPNTRGEVQGHTIGRLIGYTWPTPVTIREVALTLPPAAAGYAKGSLTAPQFVVVQGSDDGTNWRSYGALDTWEQRGDGATVVIPVQEAVPAQVSTVFGSPWVAAVSGAFSVAARVQGLDPAAARVDPMFGGEYRIAGDVAIAGTPDTPVGRRVRLYDRDTGVLVREMWSDPVTGAYAFGGLAPRTYIALSDDHTAVYNCAVADRLAPVR